MSEQDAVGKGSFIHRVTNQDLAICLVTAGVKLRKDPPYVRLRLANDEIRTVYNFEDTASDGTPTLTIIKAFSQDMAFVAENPDCTITGAICALKNWHSFHEHMASRAKTFIGFQAPNSPAVLMVVEGSAKHRDCVRKGMRRADPFPELNKS